MKTRNPLEPSSLSFSRRYFNLKHSNHDDDDDDDLSYKRSSHSFSGFLEKQHKAASMSFTVIDPPRKKLPKLKSLFAKSPWARGSRTKLTGTLFGHRRGQVRIAFQETPKSQPSFVIEIPTATGCLVKQLASGMVRVALECEKKRGSGRGPKLLEEPLWRAYCNGSKCGPAVRRECGPDELRVLEAVGPVTMGAGVLPDDGEEGELMYMRAVFERVAGSTKDSEAFYMISPDGSGGPELTLFFRRV